MNDTSLVCDVLRSTSLLYKMVCMLPIHGMILLYDSVQCVIFNYMYMGMARWSGTIVWTTENS